jgi:hypothetical protein
LTSKDLEIIFAEKIVEVLVGMDEFFSKRKYEYVRRRPKVLTL